MYSLVLPDVLQPYLQPMPCPSFEPVLKASHHVDVTHESNYTDVVW